MNRVGAASSVVAVSPINQTSRQIDQITVAEVTTNLDPKYVYGIMLCIVTSPSTHGRVPRGLSMFDMAFGLVVGAFLGYGLRAYISYYRRNAAKRRLGVG